VTFSSRVRICVTLPELSVAHSVTVSQVVDALQRAGFANDIRPLQVDRTRVEELRGVRS
jgi:hypothetical protein